MKRLSILFWLFVANATSACEQPRVAVASNFLVTAQDLAAAFDATNDQGVELVHGSTGKLFAQIRAGAPFHVFLSADQARPSRLASVGDAVAVKTYAVGRLALVHGAAQEPGDLGDFLLRPGLRFAIADPAVAPYGVAARQLLRDRLGAGWNANVVLGESVGQAFTFVATGNADAGLVALSQANSFDGDIWSIEIPTAAHPPIIQDAALLTDDPACSPARAFFDFLSSDLARSILEEAGYNAPASSLATEPAE